MTCCKLPRIWLWRLRTFLGGFGQNYPLFICAHGSTFRLTHDEQKWFWKQEAERVGRL